MLTVKKLIESHGIGKWIKISQEDEEVIRESVELENYKRGALNQDSLRVYFQEGYVVLTTRSINAEKHPNL